MCDTLVVKHQQGILFAKNSDREPSEPQLVQRYAAVKNDDADTLQATYIKIPQVADRHAVILSQPCWMWGAEMGANDQGVVIGNEAVFTKLRSLDKRLLGMDLLRLGLERGSNAKHALEVITDLLETHGQGGPAGYRHATFHYDSSFIIADANEAWLLETAGSHWVAKPVDKFAAISNVLTIGSDFSMHSAGLQDFAQREGYWQPNKDGEFNFAKAFDGGTLPRLAKAKLRLRKSENFLAEAAITSANEVMSYLRGPHNGDHVPRSGSNGDICMHAAGVVRRSQTTGSMVSELHPEATEKQSAHWFTGTSAPCMSSFKPADFSGDFVVLHDPATVVADSLWVRHENVHRRLLFNNDFLNEYRPRLRAHEAKMFSQFAAEPDRSLANELANQSTALWQQETEAWAKKIDTWHSIGPYGMYWYLLNKRDGLHLDYSPDQRRPKSRYRD